MEIPSYEVDLKFQRIRGSEGPEHVEIPSYEVDLEDQKAFSSRHRLGLSTFVLPSKIASLTPRMKRFETFGKPCRRCRKRTCGPLRLFDPSDRISLFGAD